MEYRQKFLTIICSYLKNEKFLLNLIFCCNKKLVHKSVICRILSTCQHVTCVHNLCSNRTLVMTNRQISDNYSNYINDKYASTTITGDEYANLNSYPSTINSMSSKSQPNAKFCNNDIEKLINDPLINRKDLIMLLRKRMFNNSSVLKFNNVATCFENDIVNMNISANKPAKSIRTDVVNSDYKFDLLHNGKSLSSIPSIKHPLVIRDPIISQINNRKIISDVEIISALNKKELSVLQINKSDGAMCWESLLLELYNIPFELSDDKLECLFRMCKFKIISLQREQHLFNRPSDATICIRFTSFNLVTIPMI